jgi:DNA-binding IclR family transcriptional regulator
MPPAARDKGPQAYSAPALEKGLEIIELLAEAQQPLSTRAIAERVGRSKGEIFRMVFVLVERGYLKRDPTTGELTLSNRLFDLGMRTPRSRELVEVAAPEMERLSERTGQSSHLVVINRGETVVIATAAGTTDISFTLRLGYRRPALEATSGQVIIAFQDQRGRSRMIDESLAMVQAKENTADLLSRLDAIVERGFLIAESHDVIGVTDVCAPIKGRRGRALASIVLPCFNRHKAPPAIESVLHELLATCQTISHGLS